MTVDEFRHWDGEGDTRYQLFDGVPVAMPLAGAAHGTVLASVGWRIADALDRKPSFLAALSAGIVPVNREGSYYQADVVVACRPPRRGEFEILDPILIAEVLSTATEGDDRRIKVPDYQLIPSVQEILMVDPEHPHCEVLRRFDGGLWTIEIVRGMEAAVRLASIDLDLPMAQIYANVIQEI